MQFIKFNAIDSTSAYLRRLMTNEGAKDGSVVWALEQTKGRGQPGKSWHSEGFKNLTFSVLRKFRRFPAREHFLLNIQVSLAILRVLSLYGIPNLRVKWPNDIMAGSKKICGILIENQLQGDQVKHSIIGIGMNVNQTQFPDLPHATSIAIETGKSYELETLLRELCAAVLDAIPHIVTLPVAHQRGDYEQVLFGFMEKREFEGIPGNRFKGIILGVDPQGLLVLELEDGMRKAYDFQSIRFVL